MNVIELGKKFYLYLKVNVGFWSAGVRFLWFFLGLGSWWEVIIHRASY